MSMKTVDLEAVMIYHRLNQKHSPKYSVTRVNGKNIQWGNFIDTDKGTFWARIGIEYSNAFNSVDEIFTVLSSGYKGTHHLIQRSSRVKELITEIGLGLDKLIYMQYSRHGIIEYDAYIPEISHHALNCSVELTFCNLYSYSTYNMSKKALEYYFQGYEPNSHKRIIRGELIKRDLNFVLKSIHRIEQLLECIDEVMKEPSILLMFKDDNSVCKAGKSSRKIRRKISKVLDELEHIKYHLIEQEKYYGKKEHMVYMNEKVFEEMTEVVLHPDNMDFMMKTGVYSQIDDSEWD